MGPDHQGVDQGVARVSHGWGIQAFVLVVIALIGTLPFWWTDLDVRVASLFYHPTADDPWPDGQQPLWSLLYRASPLLMGVILIGGVMALAAGGIWPRLRPLRLYGLLVIATALLGPGLLVNGVFKDHWGRPRPQQVEALGGTKTYLPPLMMGEAGKGKSFPCGHSSVGFMLGVFFLVWRRRRPWLARAALAGSVILGTLLGIGRMAAGDHFLSDVIWSGVIAYGVALTLYFGVLRIPRRESDRAALPPADPLPSRHPRLAVLGYGALTLVMLAGVLLATPVSDNARAVVRSGELSPDPRVLRIEADHGNLIFYAMGGPELGLVRLQARGFGLPTARVDKDLDVRDGVLTYRLVHRGVFTERNTKLVVGLDASHWERIEARVELGDILVHSLGPGGPELDVKSADGTVVLE